MKGVKAMPNRMKIEIRADGAHISGYVNATEKKSHPVLARHGDSYIKVVEIIEPRAFENALARGGNISVSVDHDQTHIYAESRNGTAKFYEDDIGLHADVLITDPELIEVAKNGKIKGWSFGMYNVVDEIEPRTDDLPIRHVKGFDLDHVTLVVNKTPAYSATSVEVRADGESCIEERAAETETEVVDSQPVNLNGYRRRILNLLQ